LEKAVSQEMIAILLCRLHGDTHVKGIWPIICVIPANYNKFVVFVYSPGVALRGVSTLGQASIK
jgi:hypothetical protein